MKHEKAQSAIEFIILIAGVFFFILALSAIFQQKISQKTNENRDLEMQELALAVQNELNIAAKASDGYSREFNIPQKIFGMDYDITLVGTAVYLNSTDGKHALSLSTQNATGQFIKGTNLIRKVDGEILLN
jgi:hypothetical protein